MKMMDEVIEYRKGAIASFQAIQTDIKHGCEKTLAVCQLSTTAVNLRRRIPHLEKLSTKNLSRNLLRKRNQMMKSLADTATDIENFVKNSS